MTKVKENKDKKPIVKRTSKSEKKSETEVDHSDQIEQIDHVGHVENSDVHDEQKKTKKHSKLSSKQKQVDTVDTASTVDAVEMVENNNEKMVKNWQDQSDEEFEIELKPQIDTNIVFSRRDEKPTKQNNDEDENDDDQFYEQENENTHSQINHTSTSHTSTGHAQMSNKRTQQTQQTQYKSNQHNSHTSTSNQTNQDKKTTIKYTSQALNFDYNDYMDVTESVNDLSVKDLIRVCIARSHNESQHILCKTLKHVLQAMYLERDFPGSNFHGERNEKSFGDKQNPEKFGQTNVFKNKNNTSNNTLNNTNNQNNARYMKK